MAVSTPSPATRRAMPESWAMAAANVIVDGPVSFPTRVSSVISARLARSLSRPFVIDTTVGRARCFVSSPTSLTISALSPD
jgi:hypothetical protein